MEEKKIILPSLKKLIELEKAARVEGSGIDYQSLLGIWKFHSVWEQGTEIEDYFSSTLLQVFSANLELKENRQNPEEGILTIANSIRITILEL